MGERKSFHWTLCLVGLSCDGGANQKTVLDESELLPELHIRNVNIHTSDRLDLFSSTCFRDSIKSQTNREIALLSFFNQILFALYQYLCTPNDINIYSVFVGFLGQ